MLSTTQRKELEAKDSKRGFFYGYALVVVLGFLYFCSSGIVLATATIVNPLMLQDEALGMNATMLGTGFSLFVLVQGISAPLVGALISKCGARFSMTLGAVILLCAMLALIFFVSSPIAYFVVFGVVASAATMMVGQLAVQSTLGSWFVERRGVAMTCMMVIGASSSFIAPPAVNAIMGAIGGGWRSGYENTIETERRKMEDTLRSRERICREPTRCRKGNEPKRRRTNNLLERDALLIFVHHEPIVAFFSCHLGS